MKSKMVSGPTLNTEYNLILQSWEDAGEAHTPECEECGCNLTGKQVFETTVTWLCMSCWNEHPESYEDDADDIDDEFYSRSTRGRFHHDDKEYFHSDG